MSHTNSKYSNVFQNTNDTRSKLSFGSKGSKNRRALPRLDGSKSKRSKNKQSMMNSKLSFDSNDDRNVELPTLG